MLANSKFCLGPCKLEKQLTEFHKTNKTKDGRRSICKECRSLLENESSKKRMIKYYYENKDMINKRQKELHAINPIKDLLNLAKQRSRRKNLEFSLKKEDINIPAVCPVLGIPIFVGEGKQIPNSPTLDRIDNTKGYTRDNVIVVSWRANDLKRNATIDELKKIVSFYEGRI